MRAIGLTYFIFFGIFGIFLPYISPLLEHMGFAKAAIGWIQGGIALTAVLSPVIITRLSDRYFSADRLLKACAVLMGLLALVLWGTFDQPVVFVVVLIAFAVCRAPVVPLQDALAMQVVQDLPKRYAKLRVLGSIGFALAALVGGVMIDRFGLKCVLWLLAAGSLVLVVGTLGLPREPKRPRTHTRKRFWTTLRARWWGWLAAMACHWFCFGPFHYGFTFLLQETQIPRPHHGVYWSLAVAAEIVVFLSSGWFFQKYDFRTLLFVSFSANLIRWLVLGLWPVPWVIAASQLLHGFGFALFYAAALQGIAKYSQGRDRASFQGLFTMIVGGVASFCGATVAGWLHQHLPFSKVVLAMVPGQIVALILLAFFPLLRGSRSMPAKAPYSET